MSVLVRPLALAGLIALMAAFASPGIMAAAPEDRLAPAACPVAPSPAANLATPAAATPVPAFPDGSNLPPGEPADPETAAQITSAVQELAGCLNTTDEPRLAALLTDAAIAAGVGRDDFTPLYLQDGALEPGSGGVPWEIGWVRARNIRLLEDGRVRVAVSWGVTDIPELKPIPDFTDQVYARVGGRWLLDALVEGNGAGQGEIPDGADVDPILRRATQGFAEVDSALYAEPTMAGAKFSIQAMLMVGFVGDDDSDGVGCEMFIFERGASSVTVSAFCRADEALIGRAAYLDAEVSGPYREGSYTPNRCEDVAALASSLVFSCTLDLPPDDNP